MTRMLVGVALPTDAPPGAPGTPVTVAARWAEDAGMDSVSVPDLVLGDGSAAVECVVAAASAAAVTREPRVELGVVALPARNVALFAAQIAALQHVSGDRVVLGVGAGGFPGSPFWRAAGGPRRGRGKVLDSMLRQLPGLVAGAPTSVGDPSGEPPVVLAPPATVPPVLVGGRSEAALRRAAVLADGWFPSLMRPAALARRVRALRELAEEHGRPVPRVHYGTHAALGPEATTAHATLVRSLVTDFAMAPDEVADIPLGGSAAEIADRFAAYADVGVDSITVQLDGPDWQRQLGVLADARALLGA